MRKKKKERPSISSFLHLYPLAPAVNTSPPVFFVFKRALDDLYKENRGVCERTTVLCLWTRARNQLVKQAGSNVALTGQDFLNYFQSCPSTFNDVYLPGFRPAELRNERVLRHVS